MCTWAPTPQLKSFIPIALKSEPTAEIPCSLSEQSVDNGMRRCP